MLDLDDTESIAPSGPITEAAAEPVQVGDLACVYREHRRNVLPQPGEVDADSLLRQAISNVSG